MGMNTEEVVTTPQNEGANLNPDQPISERATWTAATRKSYHKTSPENFAGPDMSFPIKDASDVGDAWGLAGHADNPDAVRSKIKSIAKRLGLESSLPDTAKEDGGSDAKRSVQAMENRPPSTVDNSPHGAMTGKHAHDHNHMDGYGHGHEHEHLNDNIHDHTHHHSMTRTDGPEAAASAAQRDDSKAPTSTPDTIRVEGTDQHENLATTVEKIFLTAGDIEVVRASPTQSLQTTMTVASLPPAQMYLPITRYDKDAWTIEGQATSEALDSYGTIFEYNSSKKAFQEWMKRGNIREQHDPRKAVGKALAVEFDDANKLIYVRARISKGAKDTWEKILDGTLSGFSVGMRPDAKVKYIERSGKQVPMYYDTNLTELSVVDSPGSPNCDISIARADGLITDVIDEADVETPPVQVEPEADLERAGARMSTATKSKMHDSIGHTLKAAASQMQNCGCDSCCAVMKMLDPDSDGDIDLGGFADDDNDADQLYGGDTSTGMDRALGELIERVLDAKLAAVYARLQSIAGALARSNFSAPELTAPVPPIDIERILDSTLNRVLDTRLTDLLDKSSLDEVRADLSAVKGQVERIAETPIPGAPVLHANALPPRPVEKRLATDPYQVPPSRGATADAVAALWESGRLNTTEKQVDAVAAALVAQRRGR